MTFHLIVELVTAIAAIISAIASRINRKAIEVIHVSINSRLTELLESVSKEQHAVGLAQGLKEVINVVKNGK